MSTAAIEPAKLLRELEHVWSGLGQQEEAGVLRACLMTLIVVTDGEAGDADLAASLGQIMRDYPSRAIVVRFTESHQREVRASVSAQCWLPFGSRTQICIEQIEIAASAPALADLPGLLRGLLAADLPVVVWHRRAGPLPLEVLEPVFALANKVLIDTAGHADPEEGLGTARWMAGRGPAVTDLSWTRLTRWRETAAQVFTTYTSGRQPQRVLVEYYGERAPVRAILLLTWLRLAFGEGPEYLFERASDCEGYPHGEVAGIRTEGGDCPARIRRLDARSVEVRIDGLVTRKLFPELTEAALLREELAITGHDPVYERTLAAAGLAGDQSK